VFTYSREYFAGVNVFLGNVKVQGAFQTLHADVSENALSTVQTGMGANTMVSNTVYQADGRRISRQR